MMDNVPKSMSDLFRPSPITDEYGNQLFSNWSVSFAPYNFNITPRVVALRQESTSWSNLFAFTSNIIDTVETSEYSDSFLRKTVVGFTENGTSYIEEFSHNLLKFKALLSICVVGLICSFILVPVVSCLLCCCMRSRRRNAFRYSPYSSESLAESRLPRHSISKKSGNEPIPFAGVSFSCGLVSMAIIGVLAALAATGGIAGSFYFNAQFSSSLHRSDEIADRVVKDFTDLGNHIADDFGVVGDHLNKDMEVKIKFMEGLMKQLMRHYTSFSMVPGQGGYKMLNDSGAIRLFFILSSWEKSHIIPFRTSLEEALAKTDKIKLYAVDVQSFLSDNESIEFIESFCQTAAANGTAFDTCRTEDLRTHNETCLTCLVPRLLPGLDPGEKEFYLENSEVKEEIEKLIHETNQLLTVKMTRLLSLRELIQTQFGTIQSTFQSDFEAWKSHYETWFNAKLNFNGACPVGEQTTTTTKAPTTSPSTTTMAPTTTSKTTTKAPTTETTPIAKITTSASQGESTSTKVATTTTTSKPVEEESFFSKNLDFLRYVFDKRNLAVVALLWVATLQLLLVIIGTVCLLIVYCNNPRHNFRARPASKLEKFGRTSAMIGSIMFVAFTGPLLTLTSTLHFYSGGVIDKSVCMAVRKHDHGLVDEMLNGPDSQNILRNVLPVCVQDLFDTIDTELLDSRVTVGKLLTASKNGDSLNAFLQLNDTNFVAEIRNLTYLNLSAKIVIYTDAVSRYMDNVSRILDDSLFFSDLRQQLDLNESDAMFSIIEDCTSCVQDKLPRSEMSAMLAVFYRNAVVQYMNVSVETADAWKTADEEVDNLEKVQGLVTASMRRVENYFAAIVSLIKYQLGYMVNLLVDNISEGITIDVGQFQAVYHVYTLLVEDYVCSNVIGSSHAFWLFVGIYLFFSTISAFMLMATFMELTSIQRPAEPKHKALNRTPSSDSIGNLYAAVHGLPLGNGQTALGAYRNLGYLSAGESNNDSAESYIMGSVISDSTSPGNVRSPEQQTSPLASSPEKQDLRLRDSDYSFHAQQSSDDDEVDDRIGIATTEFQIRK